MNFNKKLCNTIRIKAQSGVYAIFRFVLIFGLGFIILEPIIGKVLLSFMSPSDLLDNTVRLIPRNFSVYYWKKAFETLSLPNSFINSVILSVTISAIQVFTTVVVGYGLARFKFKGRNLAFAFVVIMMLVPYQVISIAQYQSFVNMSIGNFQLVDTFWPLYILAFTGLGTKEGLYIYLMRENFKTLPLTLEEAAYIDGAGVFKTFFSVMLPNARTMIATVFLFSFCWQWTDKSYTSLYLIDTKVLSNAVEQVVVKVGVANDVSGTVMAKCAASIFIMIPLIGLFVLCQRFFVKSISQSGLSSS